MALIKCSECGNEVSDRAKSCPKCGCPIQTDNTVRIEFSRGKQLFNMGCYVLDEEDNIIAECKEGQTVEFEISKQLILKLR